MRFEPTDHSLLDGNKEIPCFRVMFSHHPIVLYLSCCLLMNAAFFLTRTLLLPIDPYSLLLVALAAGWSVSVLLLLFAGGSYLYNRVDVSTNRIYGRRISPTRPRFSLSIREITGLRVTDSFFAGPLHYGRLTIRTKSGTVRLFFVREPRLVEKELRRLLSEKT